MLVNDKNLHQNKRRRKQKPQRKRPNTQEWKKGPHLLPRVRATIRYRWLPDLLDVLFVVKYFDVSTAWFVLYIVQGAHFTLSFEFQFLVFNLSGRVNADIIYITFINITVSIQLGSVDMSLSWLYLTQTFHFLQNSSGK